MATFAETSFEIEQLVPKIGDIEGLQKNIWTQRALFPFVWLCLKINSSDIRLIGLIRPQFLIGCKIIN